VRYGTQSPANLIVCEARTRENAALSQLEPIRKPSEERGTGTFCSEGSAK